jgi:hypothetical protein
VSFALLASSATAATIISATSATINSGGPGFGSINNTFDQAGLNANYTSGVTDFDSFVASTTHSFVFAGNEWFSNDPTSSASVTYNLGSVQSIDRLALWNEDASGIGTLDLSFSTDGISFSSLASGLNPINTTLNLDYGAEVFSFAATSLQFIRFDMSGCPQSGGLNFQACAIGEVAFRAADASPIPVPGAFPLILTGIAGFAAMRRRRKTG